MEKGSSRQKKVAVKREFSSGGVVYKKDNKGNLLWLITKSTPSSDYPLSFWRLQKGWLDDMDGGTKPGKLASGEKKASEEELQMGALREVREEGGVEAKIIKKLTTERYFYTNSKKERILKFVTFYLMEWLSDTTEGPDFETSEVKWLPYDEARKTLSHSGEKKILDKAKELLDSGVQGSLV